MGGDLLPVDDADALAQAVEERLPGLRSVGDVERWLLSWGNVLAVDVTDHLVKTLPPQRELRVSCRRTDGSTRVRVLDVVEEDDGVLLRGVHDH